MGDAGDEGRVAPRPRGALVVDESAPEWAELVVTLASGARRSVGVVHTLCGSPLVALLTCGDGSVARVCLRCELEAIEPEGGTPE
jgi:hypothetical protein